MVVRKACLGMTELHTILKGAGFCKWWDGLYKVSDMIRYESRARENGR